MRRTQIAQNPSTAPGELASLTQDPAPSVVEAACSNPNTPAEALERPRFLDHEVYSWHIERGLARNPALDPQRLAGFLLREDDDHDTVTMEAVWNPATPEAALQAVAFDEDGERSVRLRTAAYQALVQRGLVQPPPSTPSAPSTPPTPSLPAPVRTTPPKAAPDLRDLRPGSTVHSLERGMVLPSRTNPVIPLRGSLRDQPYQLEDCYTDKFGVPTEGMSPNFRRAHLDRLVGGGDWLYNMSYVYWSDETRWADDIAMFLFPFMVEDFVPTDEQYQRLARKGAAAVCLLRIVRRDGLQHKKPVWSEDLGAHCGWAVEQENKITAALTTRATQAQLQMWEAELSAAFADPPHPLDLWYRPLPRTMFEYNHRLDHLLRDGAACDRLLAGRFGRYPEATRRD